MDPLSKFEFSQEKIDNKNANEVISRELIKRICNDTHSVYTQNFNFFSQTRDFSLFGDSISGYFFFLKFFIVVFIILSVFMSPQIFWNFISKNPDNQTILQSQSMLSKSTLMNIERFEVSKSNSLVCHQRCFG